VDVFGSLFARIYVRFNNWITLHASISPSNKWGKSFESFGKGSLIMWRPQTIFNEKYIRIGENTLIGPGVSLSAGMVPGQECITSPVVSIGDRCLIGRGSGIVGHFSITIGNDVWTGHHVYITDQNHDYTDISLPISQQSQPERAVVIGDSSWIGYGSVVLPGVTIGRHVVVGANSVVTSDLPDYSVAVGVPARVIKKLDSSGVWVAVD
jgi:acetyltransferase-like isoleucine patch superfamily enzyme